MAARLNLRQQARFYVYRIFEGVHTLYVGKGSGKRLANQKRRFRSDGEIIEWCRTEDKAFEREVHWIAELMPTENVLAGGNGGRVKRKKRQPAFLSEIEKAGPRRYAARFLLTKLNELNCAQWGVSPENLIRLREMASGPRC